MKCPYCGSEMKEFETKWVCMNTEFHEVKKDVTQNV